MRTIWLEAIDEHGRELSAVGEVVSHHGDDHAEHAEPAAAPAH